MFKHLIKKILNYSLFVFLNLCQGNSLVVQWLGLCASTAKDLGSTLIGEPRSHKLCSVAKNR